MRAWGPASGWMRLQGLGQHFDARQMVRDVEIRAGSDQQCRRPDNCFFGPIYLLQAFAHPACGPNSVGDG
jgi:hypothetical protein